MLEEQGLSNCACSYAHYLQFLHMNHYRCASAMLIYYILPLTEALTHNS